MIKEIAMPIVLAAGCLFNSTLAANLDPAKPNVLIIYLDDLGYGDMGANAATGLKIPADSKFLNPENPTLTPNLDQFAAQGLRFTNGHSSDGVCSPSRYSLMTGHYSWRTSLKTGVTGGYSPTFMAVDRFSIGELFRENGYTTAIIGKWHIGMTFYDVNGKPYSQESGNPANEMEKGWVDFSRPVTDTPVHRGFDYWFGTSASLDMPPYAWLESDPTTGQVNVLYKGGIVKEGKVDFSQARIAKNSDFIVFKENHGVHARGGAKDPSFAFEDYLQVQAQKVSDLIETRKKDGKPFMMYIPMPSPHEPHAVQRKFEGSTGFLYGDYLVQTDFYVGQILAALGDPNDPKSLAVNTIVLITSDNGPETAAYFESLAMNHDANGPWAGRKRDSYEGGTRVPFIVRWPGTVTPGITDHPCWQGDFLATMAEYLKVGLNPNEAPDAESFLPVLLGKPMPAKRRAGFIEHSSEGQFSFIDRTGEWKLIDGTGGGGNRTTCDADNNTTLEIGEIGGMPRQLFNLKNDPGERHNLLMDPSQKIIAKERELYNHLSTIRGDKELRTDGFSSVPPKAHSRSQHAGNAR